MADRGSPVGSQRAIKAAATIADMSFVSLVRGASRASAQSAGSAPTRRLSPIAERLTRRLWMSDRGLAELRWAAVTLATMALLGLVAGLLHASGDFGRVRLVATPAAILLAGAAWGPYGSRLAQAPGGRRWLGPAVVAIAVVGGGPADIAEP